MSGMHGMSGKRALGILALALLGRGLEGQEAEGEAEQLCRSFREWARSVEIHDFACRFQSRLEGGAPEEAGAQAVTGEWRIGLLPAPRQYLGFQTTDQVGECHWNPITGEGRVWARSAGTVQASGTLLGVPPKTFGYCEYPSDLFFLIHDGRPLRRHLEMIDLEARRLDASRAVFFLKHRQKSHLLAYTMDLSQAQPVQELRMYVALHEGPPLRNQELGAGLELPADFAGAVCFSRKRVLASAVKAGKALPVRWTVEHALLPPGARYVVELDPQSLRVDEPLGDEELTARWPEGTEVFDTPSGLSFSVVGETRVEAKVISETMLEEIFTATGLRPVATADPRPAVTGCGANVLYIALRMLGEEPRLRDLGAALGIEVNQQLSSLASLATVAAANGRPALAMEGGGALLRPGPLEPVILHVRKLEQGKDTGDLHYVLIDDYDPATGTVRVIDPPFKAARSTLDDVRAVWTGRALVFEGSTVHLAAVRPAWKRPLVVALAACVLAGVLVLVLTRARKARQLVPGTLLPLALLAVLGCRPAAPVGSVRVCGEPSVDFGRVQRSSSNLTHRFEIENPGRRAVTLQDIRSTCSCISVSAETKSLAPGQRTGVLMELDTKLVVGRRKATAMLVLDAGDPVILSLEAFVESSYNVALSPGVWTLPADVPPGSTVTRTVRVMEFLPVETDASESTSIEPEDASVTIARRGPWKCQGFNARGYVRERELELSFAVPASVVPRNWTISFKFSRPGERPDGPRAEAFAQVLMNQL